MNAQTKATSIPQAVKDRVYERDSQRCINCGRWVIRYYASAHYIARSHGGLGIEENIVTLCQECHRRYDNGKNGDRERIGNNIKAYLKEQYPDWDEKNLIYHKY